jgi:hypothetical protein
MNVVSMPLGAIRGPLRRGARNRYKPTTWLDSCGAPVPAGRHDLLACRQELPPAAGIHPDDRLY